MPEPMIRPAFNPSPSLESLLGQVAGEFTERLQRGEQPDIEHYARLHPEIAELLRQILPALSVLGTAVEAGRSHNGEDTGQGLTGTLGDFRILGELGRGGMGIVYEAEQISLGRRVALKILPFAATMDPRHLRRFHNEARAAASLEHPHIVPVHGVGCERGVHYYAMKFIDGQSLAALIHARRPGKATGVANTGDGPPSSRGPAPLFATAETAVAAQTERTRRAGPSFCQVASWAIEAAEALEHAHGVGIVHRDIKPANLMIDQQGALWVTDFGLARTAADAGLTITGDVLGTLRYMSPEQAQARHGLVDHRTDIYSLGVTLYELLTGTPAVTGKDREEILNAITLAEPRPPRAIDATIPRDLETIVLRAMAKEPTERFATARELADDLRRFQEDRPIRSRRPGLWQRLSQWRRRHRVVVGTAVAGLCAGLLVLAVSGLFVLEARNEALWQRDEADRQRTMAVDKQEELRRYLYVADIQLAFQAAQNHDTTQVKTILARQVPGPGQEDLRGFEWYYLSRLGQFDVSALRGHSGWVYHVAYSRDGKWLATASKDKTVKLWSAATGALVRTFVGHDNEVNCVVFSPDGKTLISVSEDRTVRLWETATGRQTQVLRGHTDEVVGVDISPDGQWIASGSNDGKVVLWHRPTGRVRAAFQAHQGRVESLVFADGGKALLTAGGKEARLWEMAGVSSSAASSPPLTMLPLRHQRTAPTKTHIAILTPDGQTLIVGCDTGLVQLWNLKNGDHVDLRYASQMLTLALSRSGDHLAIDGGALNVWLRNLPTGAQHQLVGHTAQIFGLAFSPTGNELASASADGTVRRWPVPGPELIVDGISPISALRFSPTGEIFVTNHHNGTVRLWDAATGQFRRSLPVVPDPGDGWGMGGSLAFAPDGRQLLVGAVHSSASIWDTARGQLEARLEGPTQTQTAVAWSADGNHLVTGPGERPNRGQLQVFDARTLELKRRLTFSSSLHRYAAAVSPHAETVVAITAHSDRARLVWWHLTEGDSTSTVEDVGRGLVHCLALSRDGRLLVSGTTAGDLALSECGSGRVLATWSGHGGDITGLAFSPDGKTIASAGQDYKLQLWNVATRQALFSLDTSGSCPAFVDFSPDGQRLAVALGGQSVWSYIGIWSATPPPGPPSRE